jgi:hypothetical protein
MKEREEYLKMRKENNYNISFFYKYYTERCEDPVDFNTFTQLFPTFLKMFSNNVFEVLDKEYNIISLESKDGEVLQIS